MSHKEPERSNQRQNQFGIRHLLIATFFLAVGMALALNKGFPPAVRIFGLGICLYWVAKTAFSLSTRISSPLKEALFLLGLPLYLVCIMCLLWGGVSSLIWLTFLVAKT